MKRRDLSRKKFTFSVMRTLAIDLGSKRIGLAMSAGNLATPIDVLVVSDAKLAIAPIAKLIKDEDVERLILGLPINMDGTIGPAAKGVIAWAKTLTAACGLPILFVDERLSSFDAEQSLNERRRGGEKLTRLDKKRRLDAIAAAGFLQAFLDGKLEAIDVS